MIFVTLLRIGSLNVFVLAGARFVAGSDTGTEAGAPPGTIVAIAMAGRVSPTNRPPSKHVLLYELSRWGRFSSFSELYAPC